MSDYDKEVVVVRREFFNPMFPSEIIAQSKAFLGSYLKGRIPFRPEFTKQELEQIVYPHVDVTPDDRDFKKKYNEFWADLHFNVESGGYPLQIGTVDGSPVNIDHWIKWRWAKDHMEVAGSEGEMLGNPKFRFYLRDPDKETDIAAGNAKLLRAANVAFQKILDSKTSKVSMERIVRMLNMNPVDMNEHQLELTIDGFIKESPKSFLDLVKDKDLPIKAKILDMVSANVLRREGNHFIFIDQPIGSNMEQAVLWFKDKANSGDVALLESQYKEKLKDRDLKEVS